MQTQPTPNVLPQFPIQELEQIESAIHISQQWIVTLQRRHEALTAELERVTRPQQAAATKASVKTIGPGLEYQGAMSVHWDYIDIHIDLLRRLWTDFPEHREAMAHAVGCYGRTRAYVAKTPGDLFPDWPISKAHRYSRSLVAGWYVDTNLNRERMHKILPAAVAAAGQRWGHDVKTYWRPTQIR